MGPGVIRGSSLKGRRLARAALVVAMGVLLSGGVLGGQTVVTAPNNEYTPAEDVELGRQAAAEVEQRLPILRDEEVTQLVASIGTRLDRAVP